MFSRWTSLLVKSKHHAGFYPAFCHRHNSVSCESLNSNEVQLVDLNGEQEGISVIAFNRPQAKNAISTRFVQLFTEALESLRHNKDVRTVIIKSSVPGIFCAGADLKERSKVCKLILMVSIGKMLLLS